jgi:predicted nucleic acid-binding protein
MDEKKGRRVARELNLVVTGTLGVLLLAWQVGLLPSLAEAIERVRPYLALSDALVDEVLRRAGEA